MTTKEIKEYYDATMERPVREDLKLAVSLTEPGTAIDCGCGAGSDIAFLLTNGFTVYGFDIEPESIARCRNRFNEDDSVTLTCDSFSSFTYPAATLVCADASLFFCPQNEFEQVWSKINESLLPGGIFSGSFLGPKDAMAGSTYNKEAFWPNVLVFTEDQLKPKFKGYEIVKWTEHNMSGKTAQGEPEHRHIFSLVAKKCSKKTELRTGTI